MLTKTLMLFTLVLILLLSVIPAASAQDGTTILTVAVPEFMPQVEDETFDAFEAANPGVEVRLVRKEGDFASPARGLDAYLENVQEYVSAADLVYVTQGTVTAEATRAGLYLDLAPLTNGDPTLNSSDFSPAVWQSFQWDQGVWALPFATDVVVVTYDAAAFDAAGLAYPNASWTMDDLAAAARALAVPNADGTIAVPGLAGFGGDMGALFRSLTGESFYDPNTLPNAPQLVKPSVERLLTTWYDLEAEGVLSITPGESYNDVPIHIEGSFGLISFPGSDETPRSGTLLPGGRAGLDVYGFAVSSGTRNPDLAYALAKYLTSEPQVANTFFAARPARQSLANLPAVAEDDDGGFRRLPMSPEADALITDAIANGLPMSDLRYVDYLEVALEEMRAGADALTALQTAEAQAVTSLQTAETRRSTTIVAVATPVPAVVLAPGEIALNFGVQSFIMPFPNRELWDQVIAEFVAADPQVGQINFDVASGGGPVGDTDFASEYECYYLPTNNVPGLDLSTVYNLDPFMDTDPTFSRADVVGNALAQLQRDNQTWAFPINIQPQVLRYSPEQFAQAGIPEPTNGWTIDAFNDALEGLKLNTADLTPFDARDFGGTYLLLLTAAYGGIPLDYRTSPPTANFTDPATVNAIRQVLDLAKNGYINYEELSGFGSVIAFSSGGDMPPIFTERLEGGNFRVRVGGDEPVYALTTFPTGSQYAAVSYDVGTAYISATAQNPDACYRWISYLSQHPALFSSMPARRSLINDPAVAAAQGADAVAAYNQLDALMQNPNTLHFPSPFGQGDSPAAFLTSMWLNRAFDRYVLEDADLEQELAESELVVTAFQECIAQIAAYDPAVEERRDYFRRYLDCATMVDPSLEAVFQAF